MATRSERAIKRLQKWKNIDRLKYREIAVATSLSQGCLCAIIKNPEKELSEYVADSILVVDSISREQK